METTLPSLTEIDACPVQYVLALHDTLNVLSGKWKLPIIAALLHEKKRFRDIQRALPRLTPRVLSKELRELEANGIVERPVQGTVPVLVEYELTAWAYSLKLVLDKMIAWGVAHRKVVMSPAA